MDSVIAGILSALSPTSLLFNLIGVIVGITFGAIPGLTATAAIALLLPITFELPFSWGFSMLLGIYIGGVYAGSITSILINTPGTAAGAATLLEGPALREKGLAGKALMITTVASFVGGIFSAIMLIFVAPQLAKIALKFGAPEYFALALFGMSMVVSLSSDNLLKGITAALLGLLFSTVGLDPVTATIRYTMGNVNLMSGFNIVPVLIGLFAISQVYFKLNIKDEKIENVDVPKDKVTWQDIKSNWKHIIRSSVIGTFIGIVPAIGSGAASFIAYDQAKRFSKKPDDFGKGTLEGIAATESANNAVTGGALIPLLTLGIPGDTVTAVLLGGLVVQGIVPGPMLFSNEKEIVSGIFTEVIVANVFMLLIGLLAIRLFVKVLKIPMEVLMPSIVVLCILGGYAINNSSFDVFATIFFGVIGAILIKFKFPLAPMLLAMILSTLLESNFRRALLMSHGSMMIFVTRPICIVFLIISALVIISTFINNWKKNKLKPI
ncbi:MAG: tripartite tricarboxylate transporter permease [Dehalobacterium sp.]